jgi:hypothetical protein
MGADFQFEPSLGAASAGLEALSAAKGTRLSATQRSGGSGSLENDPPTVQRQTSSRGAAAIGLQPRLRWINEACFASW